MKRAVHPIQHWQIEPYETLDGVLVMQIGHNFIFGNTIKRDGITGLWVLSKADTRANAGTVGIVSEVIDADHFRYITGGLLPGDFVDGADYWLSTTTAGAIFIQSDPEVWEIGNVREFIGTGTPKGLEVEIDVGIEIVEMPFGEGHDVVSGNGMDFEDNTPVTLGLPSEVNSTTENEVTEHSHTHKLGSISTDNIIKVDPNYINYGALYNWHAATDSRKITSSDDWDIPTIAEIVSLLNYIDFFDETLQLWPIAGSKLKEAGFEHWVKPYDPINPSTNDYLFSAIGSGFTDGSGMDGMGSIKTICMIWSKDNIDPDYSNAFGMYSESTICQMISYAKEVGLSIRLVRAATAEELLLPDGSYCNPYIGNNKILYKAVKINTQVWTASNLNETQLRDGSWIEGFNGGIYTPITNADWMNRSMAGYGLMCYYDDSKAYGGGQVPLSDLLISEHNKLQKLQGGNAENDEFYHLTKLNFDKLINLDNTYWNQEIGDDAQEVTFPLPFAYSNGTDTCFCEINLSIIDRTNGKRVQYNGSLIGNSGFVFLDMKEIFSDMTIGVNIHLASDSWDTETYTLFTSHLVRA